MEYRGREALYNPGGAIRKPAEGLAALGGNEMEIAASSKGENQKSSLIESAFIITTGLQYGIRMVLYQTTEKTDFVFFSKV